MSYRSKRRLILRSSVQRYGNKSKPVAKKQTPVRKTNFVHKSSANFNLSRTSLRTGYGRMPYTQNRRFIQNQINNPSTKNPNLPPVKKQNIPPTKKNPVSTKTHNSPQKVNKPIMRNRAPVRRKSQRNHFTLKNNARGFKVGGMRRTPQSIYSEARRTVYRKPPITNTQNPSNISIMESKINNPHTPTTEQKINIPKNTINNDNLFENIPEDSLNDNNDDEIVIIDDTILDVEESPNKDEISTDNVDNVTEVEGDVEDNNDNANTQNDVQYITLGDVSIPATPFLWYREKQMYSPHTKIVNTSKNYMELLLKKYDENAKIDTTANDYYIIIQRNIIPNESVYVSFHSYAYYKNTGKSVIDESFNKKYMFESTCMPLTDGVIFVDGSSNYKKNVYVKGVAHIHDQSLSPINQFKFNIDKNVDTVSMLVHGYSHELKLDCLCMFIVMNDFEE